MKGRREISDRKKQNFPIKTHKENLKRGNEKMKKEHLSKDLNDILNILREHKMELREKYKVKEIGVFGSWVRKEQKQKSDIDILVEFENPIGFFEFLELEEYLSNFLEVKVDLVSKKALKPFIGKCILNEVVHV